MTAATSHRSLCGAPHCSPQPPACLLVPQAEPRWEDGWQNGTFTPRLMWDQWNRQTRGGGRGGASFETCWSAGRSTLKREERAGTALVTISTHSELLVRPLAEPAASLPLAGLTVRSKHIPQLMFALWSGRPSPWLLLLRKVFKIRTWVLFKFGA